MKKETFTLENAKQDLCYTIDFYLSIEREKLISAVAPCIAGIFLMLLFSAFNLLSLGLLIGLLPLIPSLIGAIYYLPKITRLGKLKKVVLKEHSRAMFAISIERLDHIRRETIFEPWVGRTVHYMREACFYYFASGKRWRKACLRKTTFWSETYMPFYSWSRDLFLSPEGLENVSLEGDEFFYIALQDDPYIACIYPCKFFKLDKSLQS